MLKYPERDGIKVDVTITFANEYGQAAVRTIYGIELLNEGSGASMDDVVIEETMTFIARELGPMVTTSVRASNGGVLDPSQQFIQNDLNTTVVQT